jgi:ABC-type polysaccharide/polyol phosphate transport system ATPase subunit
MLFALGPPCPPASKIAAFMSSEAIVLDRVSKRYRIYSSPQDRLREVLGLKVPPERIKEVNAVDLISLKIGKGEFCGIIGRNGAGKSTLLKIIAGQITPSEGSHQVRGRKSLLQLGRGFNPELTGRENVLNSLRLTLMAPSVSQDIVAKVVEFSELGDFIDFPIKTYSSGMYSRLAFATAVSGDPDILIADEILAVGDINFSQKCLSKMRDFKDRGKTIILVTHDITSVKVFCDRAILIEKGRIVRDGDPQEVCEDFRNLMLYGVPIQDLESTNDDPTPMLSGVDGEKLDDRWETPRRETLVSIVGGGEIKGYRIRDADGRKNVRTVVGGSMVCFDFLIYLDDPHRFSSVGFTMHDDRGLIMIHLNSKFDELAVPGFDGRKLLGVRFKFQMPHLKAGQYSFSYAVHTKLDYHGPVLAFKHDFDFSIEVERGRNAKMDNQGGLVLIREFSVQEIGAE